MAPFASAGTRVARRVTLAAAIAVMATCGLGTVPSSATGARAQAEADDQVHYSLTGPDSVAFDWHGPDATISYGPDTSYGTTVAAVPPVVTPVDSSGPFWEARLTGLAPNATYHYRIGSGPDGTFHTAPTGDLTFDAVADISDAATNPWVAVTHAQIEEDHPDLVLVGGDLSYANVNGHERCGEFFDDIQAWSLAAPAQFAWGNHEYGKPTQGAPPGTPQDSMANYKGRIAVPNPQTLSVDTKTKSTAPGCALQGGVNPCQGEDWGWFVAGHACFISYPEPWYAAIADWRAGADQLMQRCQADPSVSFIVTWGHRPAYSSVAVDTPDLTTTIDALADRYGPNVPGGKYVLNIAGHIHGGEVFSPRHGVVHITNGGGGEGQTSYPKNLAAGSVFHTAHPEHLRVTATGSTMTVRMICGPAYAPNPKDPCTLGDTLWTVTFGSDGPPPPPPPDHEFVGNPSVESDLTGWTGVYGNGVMSRVTGGYDGTYAIRVDSSSPFAQSAGFNDKPRWVGSTVAGVPYTASAWVKANDPGITLNVQLREWSPDGKTSIGLSKVPYVPTDTGWHRISVTYTAVGSGDSLSLAVFSSNLPQGKSFLADLLSETRPN